MKRLLIATGLVLATLTGSDAQTAYPDRPVKMVIPFAAGGSPDPIARLLANELTAQLGQQVIVENRPGGSSTIGTTYVAKSRPDGYTLLFSTPTQAIAMKMYADPGYDLLKDFIPISLVASSPAILVGAPDGAQDLKAYVEGAKAKPGQVAYGAPGIGTTAHLAIELFEKESGIDIKEVQYRSVEQALTDVMTGRVSLTAGFPSALVPFINTNRVRALAVLSPERLPQLPNVPTAQELGFPKVGVDAWYGVLAPAGTPPAIVERLQREVVAALPKIKDKLIEVSVLPRGSGSEEFRALLTQEVPKWAGAVEAAGIPIVR